MHAQLHSEFNKGGNMLTIIRLALAVVIISAVFGAVYLLHFDKSFKPAHKRLFVSMPDMEE
jgi:hypothetical protein